MTNLKISELSSASYIDGDDEFVINKGGNTRRVKYSMLDLSDVSTEASLQDTFTNNVSDFTWSTFRSSTGIVEKGYWNDCKVYNVVSTAQAGLYGDYLSTYSPPSQDHFFAAKISSNTGQSGGTSYTQSVGVVAVYNGTMTAPSGDKSCFTSHYAVNNAALKHRSFLFDSYTVFDSTVADTALDTEVLLGYGMWLGIGWDHGSKVGYAYWSYDGNVWFQNGTYTSTHGGSVPVNYGLWVSASVPNAPSDLYKVAIQRVEIYNCTDASDPNKLVS